MMTKVVIPIKSNVIDNDTAEMYDFFGLQSYVSPNKVNEVIKTINPDDDVELQIASNGGDVFAASEIYTAIRSIKQHVLVNIQGLAASAASVIAMAGDEVQISPTAQIMIHKAWSNAQGNADDMTQASSMLSQTDESIVNAYEAKTGMDRGKIINLMSNETWMTAQDAVNMGFADSIMKFKNDEEPEDKKQTIPVQAFASVSEIIPRAAVSKWHELMIAAKDKEPEQNIDAKESQLTQSKLAILFGK